MLSLSCLARFRHLLVSIAFLLVILFAIEPGLAQSPPKALRLPPPPAVDQEQFISYWTTETGWRTELQLRNNQVNQILSVTPVLRTPDGTETSLSPVTVNPQEVRTVDLDTAIGTSGPHLIGTYGSVVLRYTSVTASNLYAVAMIRGIGHSIAFHIDGTGESQNFQTGSREGIWWLANSAASDYLVLTNQGIDTLPLNVSVYDASGKASTQKVTLSPRATDRLSVRQLVTSAGLAGSYGGIKVSAATHAGSLDTLHVLFDQKAGFSAVMKMFHYDPKAQIKERDYAKTGIWTLRAPMLALSNPDPALAFPVGTTLHPQLFVRNTTAKPINASLLFNWRSDTAIGKAQGPTLRLNPYETRRIDVAALQDTKAFPQNARWASVTLTTNSNPDEVMAITASYDATLRYGAQTPFSDQLSFKSEGSMWEFDPYHDSIITVGNGGTKPTEAAFTIFYNQGTQKYELEQTLQPDEQMWIDIGKLIREHMPDKSGSTLPADLTAGSYEIRDLTNKGVGALFEGKVIYDKTYGHVTYGCSACCGYKTPRLFFVPLGIPFASTSNQGVEAIDTCTGQTEDITGDFDNAWSTANTSIATVDSYGTHTGVSIGSTTTSTCADLQMFGTVDCPIRTECPGGGDQVTATVSISGPGNVPLRTGSSMGPNWMTLTATGTPDGGTYTWSTSSANVTLSNTSSANVTVTAAAASQNRGDTPITVKYVINGDTNCTNANNCASSTGNITVSKPSSLFLVTDIPNSTGHTCDASATTNNCTKSAFTGSGSYTSYVRTRTYHIMNQFNPPDWISGYNMDIQESYNPPSGQCASDASVVTTSATGDTAVDCFYFCSATCKSGGSCNVSATQSITVNGYSVGTKSVTWTCSDATIQP